MLIGCDVILEPGRVNYFKTFSSLRTYIHTWTVPRSSYPFLMWWPSLTMMDFGHGTSTMGWQACQERLNHTYVLIIVLTCCVSHSNLFGVPPGFNITTVGVRKRGVREARKL